MAKIVPLLYFSEFHLIPQYIWFFEVWRRWLIAFYLAGIAGFTVFIFHIAAIWAPIKAAVFICFEVVSPLARFVALKFSTHQLSVMAEV